MKKSIQSFRRARKMAWLIVLSKARLRFFPVGIIFPLEEQMLNLLNFNF